jgi:hypothetical protein
MSHPTNASLERTVRYVLLHVIDTRSDIDPPILTSPEAPPVIWVARRLLGVHHGLIQLVPGVLEGLDGLDGLNHFPLAHVCDEEYARILNMKACILCLE